MPEFAGQFGTNQIAYRETLYQERRLWVRITTQATSSGAYGWQQQVQTPPQNGTWQDDLNGLSSNITGCPLYFADSALNIPQNVIVEAVVNYAGYLIAVPWQGYVWGIVIDNLGDGRYTWAPVLVCQDGTYTNPEYQIVACSPFPVYNQLLAVVSGTDGLDGSYPINWNGSDGQWEFFGPFGTDGSGFWFNCVGGVWEIGLRNGSEFTVGTTITVNSPFSVTFGNVDLTAIGGNATGVIQITNKIAYEDNTNATVPVGTHAKMFPGWGGVPVCPVTTTTTTPAGTTTYAPTTTTTTVAPIPLCNTTTTTTVGPGITTTTTTTTTTIAPAADWRFAYCCGSVTPVTTAAPIPTTTTLGPCTDPAGQCTWTWVSATRSWSLTCSDCGRCCCQYPSYCGTVNGETSKGACSINCNQVPCCATTTSTSTTSTTPAPCVGNCQWRWSAAFGIWQNIASCEPTSCCGADIETVSFSSTCVGLDGLILPLSFKNLPFTQNCNTIGGATTCASATGFYASPWVKLNDCANCCPVGVNGEPGNFWFAFTIGCCNGGYYWTVNEVFLSDTALSPGDADLTGPCSQANSVQYGSYSCNPLYIPIPSNSVMGGACCNPLFGGELSETNAIVKGGNGNAGNNCMCAYPTTPAPGVLDCALTNTPCVLPSTTTPANNIIPSCLGSCSWQWQPDYGIWQPLTNECLAPFGTDCKCDQPAYDGGADCPVVNTQCYCTNCTCGSTTCPPGFCCGQCIWSGNGGGGWNFVSSTCTTGCACLNVGYASSSSGETASTGCQPVNTTTTTSTTTSTTTTSTTIPPCQNKNCSWGCDGAGNWTFLSSLCDVGCQCTDPAAAPYLCNGATGAYVQAIPCCDPVSCSTTSTTSTTTSTTSTTTTSTTSTTTTAAPSYYCYLETTCNCPGYACPNCGPCPPIGSRFCRVGASGTIVLNCGMGCTYTIVQQGGGPYTLAACNAACTGTTTTCAPTTTTTSTTAAPPCGVCGWQWNGLAWQHTPLDTCTGGCACNKPGSPGTFVGQNQTVNCGTTTTTTTTAPGSWYKWVGDVCGACQCAISNPGACAQIAGPYGSCAACKAANPGCSAPC